VKYPIVRLAQNCDLPDGYRVGAHIGGDRWWLCPEEGAELIVEFRPDYAPLDASAVLEAIDEAECRFDEDYYGARY